MDTVSTTLSNCLYVLMNHPEELKKLQEEIDAEFDMTLEVKVILSILFTILK
jgi:cytochrome P450